jgi:hypothetical protein
MEGYHILLYCIRRAQSRSRLQNCKPTREQLAWQHAHGLSRPVRADVSELADISNSESGISVAMPPKARLLVCGCLLDPLVITTVLFPYTQMNATEIGVTDRCYLLLHYLLSLRGYIWNGE